VREIVTELRHHYLLAFDASTDGGWHAIAVRAGGGRLVTKTRRWYWANGSLVDSSQ
jgi:hypothetical protein